MTKRKLIPEERRKERAICHACFKSHYNSRVRFLPCPECNSWDVQFLAKRRDPRRAA